MVARSFRKKFIKFAFITVFVIAAVYFIFTFNVYNINVTDSSAADCPDVQTTEALT